MTAFIDTNVVISLLDHSDANHAWSVSELIKRKAEGPALICDIVYCEVSVGMRSLEDVEAAINRLGLERFPSKDRALFRAGKAFLDYRDKNKGPKLGVLPDFLIGASAEEAALPLMTANPKDFAGYFPTLTLISPTPP